MKLERLFEVKDGKLYKAGGEPFSLEGRAYPVKWSNVEAGAEEYNEDFLAKLRDELKAMEEKSSFVFIEPVFDKDASCEQFTAAMKHCARRIKDCISVIGFAIPEEIYDKRAFYMEELSAKHSHYCFFCKKSGESGVVLY
ncbi:MAG: hypothetical protein K5873_12560 [Treponema sp.]|nr:hypothetical protein [Treponema sp.]